MHPVKIDWSQQVFSKGDRVISLYDEHPAVPGTVMETYYEQGAHICDVLFDDGDRLEAGQGDLMPVNKAGFKPAYAR